MLFVSVKTCLAENVSVICFICRIIIVSELSIVSFSPVLLKSFVQSFSAGLECKTIHVHIAGIFKYLT